MRVVALVGGGVKLLEQSMSHTSLTLAVARGAGNLVAGMYLGTFPFSNGTATCISRRVSRLGIIVDKLNEVSRR